MWRSSLLANSHRSASGSQSSQSGKGPASSSYLVTFSLSRTLPFLADDTARSRLGTTCQNGGGLSCRPDHGTSCLDEGISSKLGDPAPFFLLT